MTTIASQITSLTVVYSTVYSDADQSKHQSSASLAFVWWIHRGSVNSPHKWPVTRKMFPFDDVIMRVECQVTVINDRRFIQHINPQTLTHLLLVPHICDSEIGLTLVQIVACHLFGAKPLSEPMLGYFQLDPRNTRQWKFDQNIKIFIRMNASENIVSKMTAILSRGRWIYTVSSGYKHKHILSQQADSVEWALDQF